MRHEVFVIETVVNGVWVPYRMYVGRQSWEESPWSDEQPERHPTYRAIKHNVSVSGTFESVILWGN